MNPGKINTLICAVFGAVYAYSLFWLFKSLISVGQYGFDFFILIRYLPTFAGITGIVIFINSKFKQSSLLRMIMCMEIMSFPFYLVWYIYMFSAKSGVLQSSAQQNWTTYAAMFLNLVTFVTSVIGLRKLSFEKTAKLTYNHFGSEVLAEFSPASGGLRFVNRLIDALLIIYVILINIAPLSYLSGWGLSFDNFNTGLLLLIEIPFILIYYIVLEGIFNTTAGKCATSTTIVNEFGERPAFSQILGRTFCRLIPFEPFSFLGAEARGWHDKLTNTYVVECVNKADLQKDEFMLDAELNSTQL